MSLKKIVMGCANYWTSPLQVGSHHIARAFARAGWDVAFISDPISPAHFLKASAGLKERFNIYKNGGVQEGKIWSYVPGSLLSPYNHPLLQSKKLHKEWLKLSFPSIVSKIKKQGFDQPDLLYYDSPIHAFLLKVLSPKYSIYRLADYNKAFLQTAAAKKELEETLLKQVDCVVYTAKGLKEYVTEIGPKQMEFIPNGVDFLHFSKPRKKPSEYDRLQGPIAVYVGAIREWFDVELLNMAAKKISHMNFIIIGPNEIKRLKPLPNLHLLGMRPWEMLPAYLQHANVGLIPFDVKRYPELIHRVNPLKLYEYMASGLPVVSMEWEELKHLNSPALLASSKEEFIALLQQTHSSEGNRDFAETYDWKYRCEQLLALIP